MNHPVVRGTGLDGDEAVLEPPLDDHEAVHGLLDQHVDAGLGPLVLVLIQSPDARLDGFPRLLLGPRSLEQRVDNVGGVEVMEHVGGGPRSGLVKEVDKSHVVGSETDAARIYLGVPVIFGLYLNPQLVDEESCLGMDDGSLLDGVPEPHPHVGVHVKHHLDH